jgi:hypothetical protein
MNYSILKLANDGNPSDAVQDGDAQLTLPFRRDETLVSLSFGRLEIARNGVNQNEGKRMALRWRRELRYHP